MAHQQLCLAHLHCFLIHAGVQRSGLIQVKVGFYSNLRHQRPLVTRLLLRQRLVFQIVTAISLTPPATRAQRARLAYTRHRTRRGSRRRIDHRPVLSFCRYKNPSNSSSRSSLSSMFEEGRVFGCPSSDAWPYTLGIYSSSIFHEYLFLNYYIYI
jgi:hypothetical protein